jgi:hypothetical protein
MTQPPLTPGTHVEIRPGAASAWGRRFPAGGQATVLAIAVPDDLVGQEIYVLPDGDPSHHTLRLRVEDLTPIEPEPTFEELAERGRQLASEREDLIAAGADPRELLIPLHPHDARPTVPAAPPLGVGTSEVATDAQAGAGEIGLGDAIRMWAESPPGNAATLAFDALAGRVDELERDRDAWQASARYSARQVERVRALADEYARGRGGPTAKRIRAALDGAQ